MWVDITSVESCTYSQEHHSGVSGDGDLIPQPRGCEREVARGSRFRTGWNRRMRWPCRLRDDWTSGSPGRGNRGQWSRTRSPGTVKPTRSLGPGDRTSRYRAVRDSHRRRRRGRCSRQGVGIGDAVEPIRARLRRLRQRRRSAWRRQRCQWHARRSPNQFPMPWRIHPPSPFLCGRSRCRWEYVPCMW